MSVKRFMAYGYDVNDCGNMVGIEDYNKIKAENAALKEEKSLLHAHGAVLESQIATLKARVAELESIIGSDELKLVLGNYKNSTLVPRHYRICESILKKIEILNSVAVRDSGCSAIRAPLG